MITNCVHILMMLAIFNPFCCCTAAAVLAVDDVEMRSCCKSQVPDAAKDDATNQGHDPADCPHKAVKDYSASLTKESPNTKDLMPFLAAHITEMKGSFAGRMAQSGHLLSVATAATAPPIARLQRYCVYRI